MPRARVDQWFTERPRRSPAEIACLLARDRFWRDERLRLLGTHPDFPDVATLLELEEELAHTFLLVLSRLPAGRRPEFAQAFYRERSRNRAGWLPSDPPVRLQLAARLALPVVELATEGLRNERIVDLLHGIAQGDDLTRTPASAVEELQKTVARTRLDLGLEDLGDPRAAAAHAVVEVLDPAGDVVSLQAVLARVAWAAVESWEAPRTLSFLLEADRAFASVGG
jgi:hypothetical protein